MLLINMGRKMGLAKTYLQLEKAMLLRLQNAKQLHVCCCVTNLNHRASSRKNVYPTVNFNQNKRQFSVTTSRNIWTPWSKPPPPAISPLPDVPVPTDIVTPAIDSVTSAAASADSGIAEIVTGAIVDPPFIELGLASSWFPNHFVHQFMEFFHLSTDLPWWSTIIIGTLVIRIISLPLFIYTRKFTINSNNHKEELKERTDRLAKLQGDGYTMQAMGAQQELKKFYRRTGTGPVRGLLVNSSMSVLFITCITAVRQMCNVPVPSMTEGGALWFMDLTSHDPYYVLPTLTGAVIGLTISISMKAGTMQGASTLTAVLRKVRFLPVFLMPLIFGRMYAAMYLYTLTTSVTTLMIQRLLLEPRVKELLKFPEIVTPKEDKNKGIKTMWKDYRKTTAERTQMKMARKAIDRARKQRVKDHKKELKDKPPITYTIGVDAMPAKEDVPDFERPWRPPRPKAFGHF